MLLFGPWSEWPYYFNYDVIRGVFGLVDDGVELRYAFDEVEDAHNNHKHDGPENVEQ